MDVCRPIGNIYHSKLAIAVDWIVFVDNTHVNGNNNTSGGSSERDVRAMTPVSSGIAAGMFHFEPLISWFFPLLCRAVLIFSFLFVNLPPMFHAYSNH